MGKSPSETSDARERRPRRIVAEMRKHPGGSGVNLATFATVQPDVSPTSAAIELAPTAIDRIFVG